MFPILPPEDLIRTMVPILCKIVGISFIVLGAIFLPMGGIFLFMHGENSKLVGGVFIGGSIFQIAIGILVVRYMPKFMLGRYQSYRDRFKI